MCIYTLCAQGSSSLRWTGHLRQPSEGAGSAATAAHTESAPPAVGGGRRPTRAWVADRAPASSASFPGITQSAGATPAAPQQNALSPITCCARQSCWICRVCKPVACCTAHLCSAAQCCSDYFTCVISQWLAAERGSERCITSRGPLRHCGWLRAARPSGAPAAAVAARGQAGHQPPSPQAVGCAEAIPLAVGRMSSKCTSRRDGGGDHIAEHEHVMLIRWTVSVYILVFERLLGCLLRISLWRDRKFECGPVSAARTTAFLHAHECVAPRQQYSTSPCMLCSLPFQLCPTADRVPARPSHGMQQVLNAVIIHSVQGHS